MKNLETDYGYIYKTRADYLKSLNLDSFDFIEKLENGDILDITCGTYNGADDTFDPWKLTKQNIQATLINYLNADYEWFDMYAQVLKDNNEPVTPLKVVGLLDSDCDIAIIESTQQIFLERN